MHYGHKRRTFFTSARETKVLRDAKTLLFEMLRSSGCRNRKILAAYHNLSILLEQYRYGERKRRLRMGRVRRLFYDLLGGRIFIRK